MNVVSKVLTTSTKSALLATTLLIVYLLTYENDSSEAIAMIFLIGYMITFIISLAMIITNVLPFYSFSKTKDTHKIFNNWFPYYAVLFFVSLVIFTIVLGLADDLIFIPVIAFLTAMLAWIWFFKKENTNENKD